MSNIKKIRLSAALILSVTTFSACSNQSAATLGTETDRSVTEPAVFSAVDSDNSITSIEPQETVKSSAAMAKEQYNVTLPVLSAASALELTKLDLPDINGHSFNLNALIDDKTFIVSLFDRVGAGGIDCGTGLYNIESKEYRALPDMPYDGYCAWNSDYVVFKEYNGDFTVAADDESVKLYLYDINACESKLVYTYSFDRDIELYDHWRNNIVLADDKIYFDDVIINENDNADRHAYLYSYDIPSGTIEKLADDAEYPFEYDDTLLYIKKDNDLYKINSLNGKYDFDLKGYVQMIIPTKNRLLSFEVLSNDDIKRETTWGVKDMLTDECILKTARTINNPVSSNSFLAFIDFGLDYSPIVYSAEKDSFIVFDDLTGINNVYWRFCNDTGMVIAVDDGETDIYRFTLK
ncbi:MAG: hypothetical protein NC203_01695 [Firmicutes bacterium]|nr:hypothetical protein [[Eubacterium] siraeum]MCM1487055.1 hypothetical protein [Bacillota bacterium]